MSELFQPITAEQLFAWVFSELETRDSILGVPRRHFFVPDPSDPFRSSAFGHPLETPFGPAAGPHTQMAQNIVAAWLCGARYIELKTVQTLDELQVPKPCIDMQDEGYNVEWSQELKVRQSFEEYLRAWVLIHALHHRLGFPGDRPGVVFNLSVGYDLAGIRQPNMQWFLDHAHDCSQAKADLIDRLARVYPAVRELDIPDRLSDNVTLSTMHGCPPQEIGRISEYLLRERGLHTLVKLNPTLLGPERVRTLLNDDLRYRDVVVPDTAFAHDLGYADAVPMLHELRASAAACGRGFGVKLTNTLEVENARSVFDPGQETMYLSGRPLHAIAVCLADRLADEFAGELPMSFSAGADCFNAPALLAAGMDTVTACSDLLKTGGYLRLLDYPAATAAALRDAGAASIEAFILKTAGAPPGGDVRAAARANLSRYAERTRRDPRYAKGRFDTAHSKTGRALGLFDCIQAPCSDRCPLGQRVPAYMRAVREGDLAEASRVTRGDNPLPCVLGRLCDHLCESACVRTHLDEPLAIREIKRFITEHEPPPDPEPRAAPVGRKAAIIGAGPGGIVAAMELARAGFAVEVFEQRPHAGGMVGTAVPEYRLPHEILERDLAPLDQLGVEFHYGMKAGRDFDLARLRRDGFDPIVIMVGAQRSRKLMLEQEDCAGVHDALAFLERAREGGLDLGGRVGVIGAGDTAMDCARVARRLADGRVTLIYRRTIEQMPADRAELSQLIEEGIEVLELAQPQRLVVADGRLRALVCRRTALSRERDASGRRIPREVSDSDFELPLDSLIVAISQHALLDFLDGEPVALNERGFIRADPVTFETSVPGLYAGGDVVNEGPLSIVEAAAAGKAIAAHVLGRRAARTPTPVTEFDPEALLRRRAQRQWRITPPLTPVALRHDFTEVVRTYAPQQAGDEAARCLDCDLYCSICVGVCPNLALMTYRSEPTELRLPAPPIDGGEIRVGRGEVYRVAQPFQIAVLTDLCNECGNCTTFCPTAGSPYRDKPRLYLQRADFEAQTDNAFMVFRDGDRWAMDARWEGGTHRIVLDGKLDYAGPSLRARIDPSTFALEHAEPVGDADPGASLSLRSCAAMYVLLEGLRRSLPFLPAATGLATGEIFESRCEQAE